MWLICDEILAKDRRGWCERVSQGAEVFMSAWRDNEREVTVTRHAQQAEKRASTLPPPFEVGTVWFFRVPPTGSAHPSPFALPIVFASRVFSLPHISGGPYVPTLCEVDFFLYGEGRVPGTGYRFLAWPRAVSCATSSIAL